MSPEYKYQLFRDIKNGPPMKVVPDSGHVAKAIVTVESENISVELDSGVLNRRLEVEGLLLDSPASFFVTGAPLYLLQRNAKGEIWTKDKQDCYFLYGMGALFGLASYSIWYMSAGATSAPDINLDTPIVLAKSKFTYFS